MFPLPSELALIGLAEPGVPNRERIVLRPMQAVNLSSFGVLAGLRLKDGTVMPLWDNFFWFGNFYVPVPSWILLYTGPGSFRLTNDVNTKQPIYEFHWNRPKTVFGVDNTVPILFQFGALAIGENAAAPLKATPPPPLPPVAKEASPAPGGSIRALMDELNSEKK